MIDIGEWTVGQLVQITAGFLLTLGILTVDNITYTEPELSGELLLMVLAFSFYRNSLAQRLYTKTEGNSRRS